MSDSIDNKVVEKIEVSGEVKDELVSKSVVDDYKKDLFKFKDKFKESEARVQALLDEKALKEKKELTDAGEWKLLFEQEKIEKTNALSELQSKSDFFIDTSKRNAIIQKIGSFKKDSYASFIDTASISVNEDGTFNADQIAAEVDRLKQGFSELINGTQKSPMPNEAALTLGSGTKTPTTKQEISSALLAELTKGA